MASFLSCQRTVPIFRSSPFLLSRGIIDTLNGLLKEFEERLATLEKEEEAAQASFDEAAKSKREEIDTAKSTLETREEQLADNESALRASEPSCTGCEGMRLHQDTEMRQLLQDPKPAILI